MQVHKGLLRQRGHGVLGSLLKFGIPVAGGLLWEVVGGLIKNKIQKGKGIGDTLRGAARQGEEALRGVARRGVKRMHRSAMTAASGRTFLQGGIQALGNTAMDVIDKKRNLAQGLRHYGTHALKQAGNTLVEQKMRQNLPIFKCTPYRFYLK